MSGRPGGMRRLHSTHRDGASSVTPRCGKASRSFGSACKAICLTRVSYPLITRSIVRACGSTNGSSRRARVSNSCVSSASISCQLGGPTNAMRTIPRRKRRAKAKLRRGIAQGSGRAAMPVARPPAAPGETITPSHFCQGGGSEAPANSVKRHRLVIDFGKPRAHAANNGPLMPVTAQRQRV